MLDNYKTQTSHNSMDTPLCLITIIFSIISYIIYKHKWLNFAILGYTDIQEVMENWQRIRPSHNFWNQKLEFISYSSKGEFCWADRISSSKANYWFRERTCFEVTFVYEIGVVSLRNMFRVSSFQSADCHWWVGFQRVTVRDKKALDPLLGSRCYYG